MKGNPKSNPITRLCLDKEFDEEIALKVTHGGKKCLPWWQWWDLHVFLVITENLYVSIAECRKNSETYLYYLFYLFKPKLKI